MPEPSKPAGVPPVSDPLGVALHALRLSGAFYCRTEAAAPWGLELPPLPGCLMFHVVTSGRCCLEVPEAPPRTLLPGSLVLVPRGAGHVLADAPGRRAAQLFALEREMVGERFEILRLGGGGERATLLCGAVRFDDPAACRLIDCLPPLIHVDAAEGPHADWMSSTVRLVAAEAAAMRPGGEAVITRLSDVLVIQAIRAWLGSDPAAHAGWIGALRDERIGAAIACVHRDPAHPWTLAALARAAGMSRSAFAARFAALVGEPPMQYVTRWRMLLAKNRLQAGNAGVAALAAELGYASEAAFSRAFKRVHGAPPGAVRRRGDLAAGPRATPAGNSARAPARPA